MRSLAEASLTLVSDAEQPLSKREIRRRVISARTSLAAEECAARAIRIGKRAVALVDARGATTVSAYVSIDGEPGTDPLIDTLHESGITVLLPVLRDDFDLEWATYAPGAFRPGRFGLLEPATPNLGRSAIHEAGVIFCPGVAGTAQGLRLGRGGGSYDRALGRANPTSSRCLLLYDDEVIDAVPTEPHDALVDFLCTPDRMLETSPGRFEHQSLVGG